MREVIVEAVIWYAGAITVLAILSVIAALAVWGMAHGANRAAKNLLLICQLSTARYWVDRMDKEGLTVCRKEYQRMVAERKPKTIRDFSKVEAELKDRKEAA